MKIILASIYLVILVGCHGRSNIDPVYNEDRATINRGTISVLVMAPVPHSFLKPNDFIVSKLSYSISMFDPGIYNCDLNFLCKGKLKKQTRGPIIIKLKKSVDTLQVQFKVSKSDIKNWSDTLQCQFVITEGLKNTMDSRAIVFSDTIEYDKQRE